MARISGASSGLVANLDGTEVGTGGLTDAELRASPVPVEADHVLTGIAHGIKTVSAAGTDEPLVASSTPCRKVVIQAQTDNTGYVAVGGSGVDATVSTGTGILLSADDVLVFQIDDLADVYIDSTVNGEGVRYTYFT